MLILQLKKKFYMMAFMNTYYILAHEKGDCQSMQSLPLPLRTLRSSDLTILQPLCTDLSGLTWTKTFVYLYNNDGKSLRDRNLKLQPRKGVFLPKNRKDIKEFMRLRRMEVFIVTKMLRTIWLREEQSYNILDLTIVGTVI